MTKSTALCGVLATAILASTPASAPSGDTVHCASLVKNCECRFDMGAGLGREPQILGAREGVELSNGLEGHFVILPLVLSVVLFAGLAVFAAWANGQASAEIGEPDLAAANSDLHRAHEPR